MARHKEKMAGASLKQFGQVQTMKLALSKMAPEARNSERGRALEARLRAATEALSRNEYFPHKDLLDGSTPAYVGTTGTVVKVGDHLKQADGSVHRVDQVDLGSQKFKTVMVSGPDYAPERTSNDVSEIAFAKVEAKSNARGAVTPTSFDKAAHAERVMDSISSYSEIAKLDPDSINANRDRLRGQLKWGRVPYLDPETGMVKETMVSGVPSNAQILWPHDGEALEHLARTMAHPHADPEWRYHGIAESLTGRSWSSGGVGAELAPKIAAYREQHQAMAEQGPKEGDTRINRAGHQEVLRNGSWTLVDQGGDAPAPQAKTPVAAAVDKHRAELEGVSRELLEQVLKAPYFAKLAEFGADAVWDALQGNDVAPADGSKGKTDGWRAMADLVGGGKADKVEQAILDTRKEGWVGHTIKEREVRRAIAEAMGRSEAEMVNPEDVEAVFEMAKQHYGTAAPAASSPRTPVETPQAHPDPLGAIREALIRIEDADDDRGKEKNDMGWGAFTRDFGSSLAQHLMSGGDLTPNQYRKAWEMLTSKHRPQAGFQATTEELNAALQSMPAPAVKASLKETRHAKKGIDLHVVAMEERVDRGTYDRLNAQAKRLGGYYSAYNKQGAIPGFQFEDRESAEQMMDYVYSLHKSAPTYTILGVPYLLKAVGGVAKLVKKAAQKPLKARLYAV
jgi:hypothetical protein